MTHCNDSARRPYCVQPRGDDGLYHFRYWINPARPTNALDRATIDELIRAIRYAATTWEYSNPRLRMDFMGITDRVPASYDGFNDVSFTEVEAAGRASQSGRQEVDIALNVSPKRSEPCRFSCPSMDHEPVIEETRGVGLLLVPEIGGTILHEFGHALGLDHPDGGCLTMQTDLDCPVAAGNESGRLDRFRMSLAKGELLAIRYLYPYTCPTTPRGYREPATWNAQQRVNHRTWLPWRYRQVCPTLAIGNP